MSRQAFVRVLLSLLLLVSQQLAVSHAMSHVGSMLAAAAHDDGDNSALAKAIALEQSCHQCLAFAQLAGPLGSSPRSFAALDLVDVARIEGSTDLRCARTVCVFQPRAPPQA